ncbi:hypothetical protein B9Z55_007182 [Caenorhabditis nigoni]|uniref:Uncharacterized protein n=1 Tax=Caenorhabditis nigoni TaxID=1611254 RepID=A0A2G5V8C4_9PELO|nr:hypothetical protein B9Z55_007182 [Caenorhabditis nigoni]
MKKNRDLKEQIFPLKRHLGKRAISQLKSAKKALWPASVSQTYFCVKLGRDFVLNGVPQVVYYETVLNRFQKLRDMCVIAT